ncbi:MAG: PilZ domain-containing protein [Acidobacteria bacterium]|nr:PilZ domain-containing protein [Acidobacteriota bacterium]
MTKRQPEPMESNAFTAVDRATSARVSVESAEAQERRSHARYPFSAAAEVIELQTEARILGRTSDLGVGGCYVDTINPLPVGTAVKLLLTHGNTRFESQAAVIYAHVGMGMGLAFTEVLPEGLEVLRGWLAELTSGSAGLPSAPAQPVVAQASQPNERRVLKELIGLLVAKKLLTENEGATLLRVLFR